MIEATTNPKVRRAFQTAHAQRSAAMQSAWGWLFGRRAN